MHYDAVLFDWMLTLAHYPSTAELISTAAEALGRSVDATALAAAVDAADDDPDVAAAMATVDCSVEEHLHAEMLRFRRAGLDDELATAAYALIGHVDAHPVYPEAIDVVRSLRAAGCRVVVLSDIHVDLRAHARAAGISDAIDGWVLSFEHGIQKPDPAFFQLALDAAGVTADRALMVGDRYGADGAARLLGIDSLIFPVRGRDPLQPGDRLPRVLHLAGIEPS